MIDLTPFNRGDAVEVAWVDICEDPTGDPDKAHLATRHDLGYFWSAKDELVVLTHTMDEDISGQQGWIAIPQSCVREVKILKKRRVRKVKANGTPEQS